MKELITEAKVDNLYAVLEFINAELERHNCPLKLQNKIAIAAEEIFVNIAKYAYPSDEGRITIHISAGEEGITIRYEDAGIPFNPLEQANPDLDKPLKEREVGGLGIFMVKQIMDVMEYKYEDNKNILIMTKNIK